MENSNSEWVEASKGAAKSMIYLVLTKILVTWKERDRIMGSLTLNCLKKMSFFFYLNIYGKK